MTPLETLVAAYTEAIYFTDTGDTDQPANGTPLSAKTKADAYLQCRNFYWAVTENLDISPSQLDWAQVGHDLWLTRNRQGSGFWDRDDGVYGLGPNGEDLRTIFSAMAVAMGTYDAEFQST